MAMEQLEVRAPYFHYRVSVLLCLRDVTELYADAIDLTATVTLSGLPDRPAQTTSSRSRRLKCITILRRARALAECIHLWSLRLYDWGRRMKRRRLLGFPESVPCLFLFFFF